MKFLVSLFIALFLITNSFAGGIEDYPFELNQISGIQFEIQDQLHTLVDSITTSDKNLFPGTGQIIIHTTSNDEIKGLLFISPDEDAKFIYVSVKEVNKGKVLNILKASKFGQTLTVLKVQLLSSQKVNAKTGGFLKVEVLKNGLFKSYFKFKMKVNKVQGDWIGYVEKKNKFQRFKSIHIKASLVGSKSVQFK